MNIFIWGGGGFETILESNDRIQHIPCITNSLVDGGYS